MRLAEHGYNAEAYKSLRHKIPRETLRKRGIEYVADPPPRSLQPRWLQYVTDRRWLEIQPWLDLANRLTLDEPQNETPPLRPRGFLQIPPAASGLPTVNFGIRNFRIVGSAELHRLVRQIREALEVIVSFPRPAGIEHVEPDPFTLFLSALGQADPARIRRCPVCAKFFYARRIDQMACSPPCANTERQRRLRERRRVYENNRKRNRAARKARAELHKSRQLR